MTAKKVWGPSHWKYLGWWQGGESGARGNLSSCLSGFRLRFLSLVQKERPQEWPVAFRLWQGYTNRAVSLLGWVGTEAGREACSGLLGVQGTTRAGGRWVSENRGLILGINPPLGFLSRLHNPRQVGQSLLLRGVDLLWERKADACYVVPVRGGSPQPTATQRPTPPQQDFRAVGCENHLFAL